jgi:hypothetical protein
MTLDKYYRNAALIPSAIVITCHILFLIIYVLSGADKDYKSEWMTADGALTMTIFIIIINALLVCALSLTIFLNKYESIKSQPVLSMLTWFLLPMIWIGGILNKHVHYLVYSHDNFGSESIFVFSNTLPYLTALVWTFWKFRINSKSRP